MPVLTAVRGTINPSDIQTWWCWCKYPNNNPDLFLDWLVRPVYPPGHLGHPQHFIKLLSFQVERDPNDTTGGGGLLYRLEFQSTGSHFTEFEILVNYTQI